MCCFWLSGDSRRGGVEGIVDDDDIDDDVVMFIHKLLSFCMCLALILQHRGFFLHRELFDTHESRSICFTRSQLQLDFCSHHYYQLFPWHPTTIRNSISTHFFNCKRIVVRFTVSQLFFMLITLIAHCNSIEYHPIFTDTIFVVDTKRTLVIHWKCR